MSKLQGQSGHKWSTAEAKWTWKHYDPEDTFWATNFTGYNPAHDRVRYLHGSASTWDCAFQCGKQAQQWAYLHDAEVEYTDNRGRVYSLNPYDYAPMCIPCHRQFDKMENRSPLTEAEEVQ